MSKPRLLLTLDSMRHENTGLHTFGTSLGREIIRQTTGAFDVSAYVESVQAGVLGDQIGYLGRSRLHRWLFPYRDRFDVVHFADQYCRFNPGQVNAPTVMTVHDLNQVHEYPPGSRKRERHMRRMQVRVAQADRIVAISRFVEQDILHFFPDAQGKTSVIYNGADFSCAPDGYRPRYQPPGPFLFSVGMVCAKKNFHVLVPLLRGNDLHLVISGIVKEDYRKTILDAAAACGVQDRVVITGPVSHFEKSWYYANCEAFLFPSLAEGFGLPAIEAMHHGRPVFLSNLTSLPEVGGNAAYYFDSFDPDHMRVVFEGGLRDFRANRGAERARTHACKFTWEAAAASYIALYRECLERRGRP